MYVPNVYDRGAKEMMIQKLGGPEGLQQAIAQSWLTSYQVRPEVKARVDEYLMELNGYKSVDQVTPEVVQKHAMDKAYVQNLNVTLSLSAPKPDATQPWQRARKWEGRG